MKTNKDHYDLRFSSEELLMIDTALSNAGVDKDQQDAYNRLRHLLSKHVEINQDSSPPITILGAYVSFSVHLVCFCCYFLIVVHCGIHKNVQKIYNIFKLKYSDLQFLLDSKQGVSNTEQKYFCLIFEDFDIKMED